MAATGDFSRTERTEEMYDPDRTAVRESRTTRDGVASAGRAGAALYRLMTTSIMLPDIGRIDDRRCSVARSESAFGLRIDTL